METMQQKITGFAVKSDSEPPILQTMPLERGEILTGSTYKIKPPVLDSAMYITINDITLPDGSIKPFELFINCKHMDNYQWIAIVTRLVSAIWRTDTDPMLAVHEMKQIFAPNAGYFAKGYGFVNSIVAHIGLVIEQHLQQTR